MAPKKVPLPEFDPPPPAAWRTILKPATIGSMMAAIFAAYPNLLTDRNVPVPNWAAAALVGFLVGYGTMCFVFWLQLKVLASLFTYHGWVYDQRSNKTKVWAMLVKFLKGPGPHGLDDFQPLLPKFPLPELPETLQIWKSVTKQLLSPEEFRVTEGLIAEFQQNEGPQLQEYLTKRSEEKDNWLSDYWMSAAYLSGRGPIPIHSNIYFNLTIPEQRCRDPLARAANWIAHTAKYSELVLQQRLPPVLLQDLVPLCMNGYKYVFNCTRVPGEHCDTLEHFQGKTHIVIMRKGYFFKLEMYYPDLDDPARLTLITRTEIYHKLQQIVKTADELPPNPLPVGALTTQKRDVWFKHREMLKAQSPKELYLVDSALFVAVLDDNVTKGPSDHGWKSLAGAGRNRWFDKSFQAIIYEDSKVGYNIEHSAIDATVMTNLGEYNLIEEQYDDEGGLLMEPAERLREIPAASLMEWDLRGMEGIIMEADKQFTAMGNDIEVRAINSKYGKDFMKKCRVSPDGYIQMALQLAFHRLHKVTPKTYEPAMARMFLLGRTETVHPISEHSNAWVRSMDDVSKAQSDRTKLLRAAIKHQTSFRLDATVGKGCDRHLLGLYCAAMETGMGVPKLFMDKPFRMGFRLSTSQVPIALHPSWNLDVDQETCTAGFGAVCNEGYGVTYVHMNDDLINLTVTSWRSCEETSSERFEQAFHQAMADMRDVFS